LLPALLVTACEHPDKCRTSFHLSQLSKLRHSASDDKAAAKHWLDRKSCLIS
jgi:hypothetical protein